MARGHPAQQRGHRAPGGLADTTVEMWDRTLAVNLKSVFLMCRSVVPQMERQGAAPS